MTVDQGSITIGSLFRSTNTVGLDTAGATSNFQHNESYSDGTGANQVQKIVTASLNLVGAAQTIDLQNITDAFGNTVVFTKVKSIFVRIPNATTGQVVTIQGGAANPFTAFMADPSDKVTLKAGGAFVITSPVDGYTVDGTHKTLKFDPGASTIVCQVQIAGSQ